MEYGGFRAALGGSGGLRQLRALRGVAFDWLQDKA